jgi:hypothetical protein
LAAVGHSGARIRRDIDTPPALDFIDAVVVAVDVPVLLVPRLRVPLAADLHRVEHREADLAVRLVLDVGGRNRVELARLRMLLDLKLWLTVGAVRDLAV